VTTNPQTIADQVLAFNERMSSQAPERLLERFVAEQADLDAAGVPSAVLAVGDAIPDADLLDAHGNPTTLRDTVSGRPAVVVFYRGAWCPYCNIALRSYQEQVLPTLQERGIVLVAVSPQKPDGSLTTIEANELTFSVLSDEGNKIATQLGILTHPSDGVRKSQRELGIDVAGGNLDGTDNYAMPTVVLIDRDQTIRWIDVRPNYTSRTEPAAILRAVATHLS
jgi:peroxiredoxin